MKQLSVLKSFREFIGFENVMRKENNNAEWFNVNSLEVNLTFQNI